MTDDAGKTTNEIAIRKSQRMAWRERLVNFLVPRLSGTIADQEAAMEMVLAAIDEAHGEGIDDAAFVVDKIAASASGDRKLVLDTVHSALIKLRRLNTMERVQ